MSKETRMYVQLGKRYKNGKIAKAENYDIEEFLDVCFNALDPEPVVLPKVNWLDKIIGTKKYKDYQRIKQHTLIVTLYKVAVKTGMRKLINDDNYGRK